MKINNYKYWIFYINPEIIDELSCDIDYKSCIYAYTDNKTLADMFELNHDMTKFIKKKVLLSKIEVNLLARNEQTQYLKKRKFLTHDNNGKSIEIEICLTMQEEKLIDLQVITSLHNFMYKIGNSGFPINILCKELINVLEHFHFSKIMNNSIVYDDIIYITDSYIKIKDKFNTYKKIYSDEVSIYVYLFGNILKQET